MPGLDLVILDLDGTILEPESPTPISHPVRAAIGAVQGAGVTVTLASGRPFDFVRQIALDLTLTTPVVTTQGAVIGDPHSGQILFRSALELELAHRFADWLDRSDLVALICTMAADGSTVYYQNRELENPQVSNRWFSTRRVIQPKLANLLQGSGPLSPLKFIVVNQPPAHPAMDGYLQQEFGQELHISRTHDSLIEITALGVDKGQGVRRLLAHLNVPADRVLAIGDNENDIPVLQSVGFGIAMGHAPAAVKSVARWTAPAIDQDGAAVALRRWVLCES